jgi:NAD(P)-dependent dehydrogenase (short-subunit alcohol dehydrogenase family)
MRNFKHLGVERRIVEQRKVVLVTGGGKGVGRGISERFLAAGFEVLICGRNAPEVLPQHEGRSAQFLAADVRDRAAVDTLFARIAEKHGRLDVLAVEWAPKVRVVAVSPGLVQTEQSELHYGDEAGIAAVAATIPAGRLANPGEIGDACVWISSPAAAYASGINLLLHGAGERPAFLAAAGVNKH